ncbi:MAG TPA: peptidoglycan recognition family protein [Verrucomicrobiae bacterium]|nr:peptidoglycan recognition family protein [Verrucomicrobiae bacterium]
MPNHLRHLLPLVSFAALLGGCAHGPQPGTFAPRAGDEIVVAGQFFHTGTPVVLWMDPGGYDAYRVERRFAPLEKSDWEASKKENPVLITPNRYGLRRGALSDLEAEEMRGGGWDLLTLQRAIDQFVIHFDAGGTSRQCFKILQDARDLSVHFMLDLDGTIYQTLDLKERAWHATTSNTRSIGIEIANIGAYPLRERAVLDEWYKKDADGSVRIQIPERYQPSGIHTENFVARPVRLEPIFETIQGEELIQYDFTPEQYESLIKLTASLCNIFPNLRCDYPRDDHGQLLRSKLPDGQLKSYRGLLGHFHVQSNKVDPGPAFQWERVRTGSEKYLK